MGKGRRVKILVKFKDWVLRGKWWMLGVLGLLLILSGVVCSWDWLVKVQGNGESNAATIRNVVLVIGGLIALPLTLWRIRVADRQAKAAQHQARTTQRQARTAQRQAMTAQLGLVNERYQKATEMLGSEVLSVRLGGIYALQRLAKEDPKQYHVQIRKLFCAFVRYPVQHKMKSAERKTLDEDVQAIMEILGDPDIACPELEKFAPFILDLRGANLRYGWLGESNLAGVNFEGADLTGASLAAARLSPVLLFIPSISEEQSIRANLTDANLTGTDLTLANLGGANLSGINLTDANLTGTDLTAGHVFEMGIPFLNPPGYPQVPVITVPTTGLTQAQLDRAKADPENPPTLQDCVDAQTGKPLVWNGGSL